MSPTLRPYQLAQLDAIKAAVEAGTNRVLVKSPTGTGKTVAFAAMPSHLSGWLSQFPKGERKMLVIAHREELLDQAAQKIHAANPELRVSVEQGDRHASSLSDVVVASIQTLAATKYKRLERLMARHVFRLVVVDEAHHSAAATYRTTLAKLGFLPMADASDESNTEAANFTDVAAMTQALHGWDAVAPKDRLLVGVTATPNRTDAIGLGCVFQTIAYSYALRDAITDGWLVPPVPWVVETDTSLDDVKVNRGEFNQRELGETVNTPQRNTLAVAAWHDKAPGRSTIAFTVDVAHAHALAQVFRDSGIPAAAVSGETPKDERRAMLERFRRGELTVLANCMILTEGTDLPMASCILHAKPTKSATLYEQMSGRGFRLYPGKTDCIVIDIVDVAKKHSLQTAPVLYGLPPGLSCKGKTLEQAAKEVEDFLAARPSATFEHGRRFTLEDLKAKASTFDVWQVDMGVYGQGLTMQWLRSGEAEFRLSYPWMDGTETVAVGADMLSKFEVRLAQLVRLSGKMVASAVSVVASGFQTAQQALIAAEAFISSERSVVTRLKASDASWRSRPASDKQMAFLRRMKIPIPGKMTAGDASNLIDVAMARRRRSRDAV